MRRTLRALIRFFKSHLYFFVAGYFAFFARIYLKRWNPQIITVTGSSGKTTLLHAFESQLGERACYSHHANSTFGIPFHILGLERKTYHPVEWLFFALIAPLRALRKVRDEKIYVTEADAERPGEGQFLGKLLQPDILVWISLEEAHGVNFDSIVEMHPPRLSGTPQEGNYAIERVRKVIAHEFGYLLEHTKVIAVLNKDNSFIAGEASRVKLPARVTWVKSGDVKLEGIERDAVRFSVHSEAFSVHRLVPPDAGLSLFAVITVLRQLQLPIDYSFAKFTLPPGRSSVLQGVRGTTIIDSSYNGTIGGMHTMLDLFEKYPATGEKWLVMGDMVEQGASEAHEHEILADLILRSRPQRVVLVGPRLRAHTLPVLLMVLPSEKVFSCERPDEALVYLKREIKGGETILFKGARYLEGIVEQLLADPKDASKLCRREAVWVKKRKEWGV